MADTMVETGEVTEARRKRERRIGTVVARSGDKTIKVRFEYMVKHPKYGKYYRCTTMLQTHDERNEGSVGDLVEVMACRRTSKTKYWRLTRVVRAAS